MSCYFSACCIASCEPAQIHGSISKMKMEIQKTSRYEKRALTVAFVHTCILTACADPGIFVKGGPGPMARKQPGQRFFLCLSPQLIFQFTGEVHWFYYRENYTLPRIQHFSRGGGGDPASSGGRGGGGEERKGPNAYF